jgi:poly-gamma-glutamate synthesis protein (capsule biosynthesis protein)
VSQQDHFTEFFIKNAKADLVIMHHPHVVQGIRILNNRTIFYSLGNFVFGGYYKVSRGKTGTNSLYTMAVQMKLFFTDSGKYKGQQAYIYPAYDSGTDPINNYQPVRVNAEEAVPVVEAIQNDTAWKLPEIREDETGKAYLVLDYLPAGESGEAAAEREAGEPEGAPGKPAK